MLVVGLTGGIGSGKSTVSAMLAELGAVVIDADAIVHEVQAPGGAAFQPMVDQFGPDIVGPDGALDRQAVAAIVFNDPEQLAALNAIVHPRVTALTLERAGQLRERGEPLACYEAALIIENKVADAFRPLVVVSVPEDIQIARACARDAASAEDIKARIRAQVPLSEKLAVADFVIENTGTLDDLHRRTDEVLRAICERIGVDATRYGAAKAS